MASEVTKPMDSDVRHITYWDFKGIRNKVLFIYLSTVGFMWFSVFVAYKKAYEEGRREAIRNPELLLNSLSAQQLTALAAATKKALAEKSVKNEGAQAEINQ